jgi:multidrug efflux pump subunit AcrA (membrane-fusion protein)
MMECPLNHWCPQPHALAKAKATRKKKVKLVAGARDPALADLEKALKDKQEKMVVASQQLEVAKKALKAAKEALRVARVEEFRFDISWAEAKDVVTPEPQYVSKKIKGKTEEFKWPSDGSFEWHDGSEFVEALTQQSTPRCKACWSVAHAR